MAVGWTVLATLSLVASLGFGGLVLVANSEDVELVTIEGTVVEVEWNPVWEVTVEMLVESSGTTYTAELGPPWWWAENELPIIEVDDTLKVTGILTGNVIEAFTISVNGGPEVVLREEGMPPWAQERSGLESLPPSD